MIDKIKNRLYNLLNKELPVLIFLLPIIGILVTVSLIMGASYFTFKKNYEKQKEIITKEFFANLKKTTKQRVELAYDIVKVIYESNAKKPNQKELTISLMRKIFDKMRWGKKGYIFVLDFHGNTLYHPDKRLMQINRWNLQRGGVKIVQLLTKSALAHPEGTYVRYLAYNPTGKKPLWKISYVKVFKPLKFFIGNGVYLNTLDKNLLKKQKEHKKLFDELARKIFSITFYIVLVMLIITAFIALMVKRIFQRYERELQNEKQKLFQKATLDSLTGLYNRETFKNELKENLKNLNNSNLAVIFIDLDRFKEINDTFGHAHGDKLLKEVAKRLKSCVRNSDRVARFGGDEFVIMLNNVKDRAYVSDVAHRILTEIKKPLEIDNHVHHLTTSIGISIAPMDTLDAEELLKHADTAMYKAKMGGKDKIEFFTKNMSEEVKERVRIKNLIYKGIENNEFVPFFQPQIDKNKKLYGSEVLTRWKKGDEFIAPYKFIPIATELGLIDKIDLLVIENAMKIYNEWLEKGYNPGVISCNITMQQIEKTDFVKDIKALLDKYNFNPKNLNLEITENSIMNNVEKSIDVLRKINELGININIDDFGTGYSSLSYLKKLPVSKLKIDREFIRDIPEDKDDVAITQTIINLAKNLNLEVVAEGVETILQEKFVIEKGCDYIQGYFYSPPVKQEEFEEKFLKEKNDTE